jgi:HK97 family phage prohead protease
MPYFITDSAEECSGWATIKEDGEVIGCHDTKQAAIAQMVAVSLAENIPVGGERKAKKKIKTQYRELPDNYRPALSEDVPEGRACGNCYFYNEGMQITEDGTRKAWCERWEDYVDGGFYCNAWQAKPAQARQVDLSVPDFIRDNAEQGLRWHREGLSGDGLVERTVREAAAMARGDVTEDKVRRMAAWFARHMSDLAAPSAKPDHPDYPSPGVVAHALWGGGSRAESERAMAWAEAKVKALDSEERNGMTTQTGGLVTSNVETRDLPMTMANFEFRDDSDYMSFRGYAAVFNSESEPLPFRETILPGAFSRSLRSRNNVKMFVNHNMDQVLASSRAGTLKLSEDNRGLLVEADLPPTTYAKDLSIMMRRGDVDSMSFGFSVPRNGDTWNEERTERTLKEVRLHEVSIVTSFPAYAATTAQVRTIDILAKRAGCEVDSIADAIRSIENGSELSAEQREVIAGLVDALTLKSAPAAEPSQKLNTLRAKLDHAYKAI